MPRLYPPQSGATLPAPAHLALCLRPRPLAQHGRLCLTLPATPGGQDLTTGVPVVALGAALPGAEPAMLPLEGVELSWRPRLEGRPPPAGLEPGPPHWRLGHRVLPEACARGLGLLAPGLPFMERTPRRRRPLGVAGPASPQTRPRQALPSVLPPSGQRLSSRGGVCAGRRYVQGVDAEKARPASQQCWSLGPRALLLASLRRAGADGGVSGWGGKASDHTDHSPGPPSPISWSRSPVPPGGCVPQEPETAGTPRQRG